MVGEIPVQVIQFEYNNESFYVKAHSLSIFQALIIRDNGQFLDHIKCEYIYQISQYFAKYLPDLKIININLVDIPNDNSITLACEKFAINEHIYGELFASVDLIFELGRLLGLSNYLKLPKVSGIKWQSDIEVHNNKYSLKSGEYLYSPSDKVRYLSIKLGFSQYSYTIYVDEQLILRFAQLIFTPSLNNFQPFDMFYAKAIADIVVSQISCQFKIPLILEQVQYRFLDPKQSYLPIMVSGIDFNTTILMSNWHTINWQTLYNRSDLSNLTHSVDLTTDVAVSEQRATHLALQYSLLAGDMNLTGKELRSLQSGDILLLDNCYMPDSLQVDLGRMDALFKVSNKKITLSSLSAARD